MVAVSAFSLGYVGNWRCLTIIFKQDGGDIVDFERAYIARPKYFRRIERVVYIDVDTFYRKQCDIHILRFDNINNAADPRHKPAGNRIATQVAIL